MATLTFIVDTLCCTSVYNVDGFYIVTEATLNTNKQMCTCPYNVFIVHNKLDKRLLTR